MAKKPDVESNIENDIENDIENIMGEIEDLQKGMRAPAVKAPALKSIAGGAAGTSASPASKIEVTSDGLLSPEEEEDILKEFQAAGGGAGGEGGLEDTLADLKGEETNGNSLLDQAIAASGTEEAAAEFEAEDEAENQTDGGDHGPAEVSAEISEGDETMSDESESSGSNGGSLTMTLTGDVTLKLRYASGDGQEVSVGFGDGALNVRLADGTEFKIPVRRVGDTRSVTHKPRKVA